MKFTRSTNQIPVIGILGLLVSCASYLQAQQSPTLIHYRLSVAERKWAVDLNLPTVYLAWGRQPNLPKFSFIEPVEGSDTSGGAKLSTIPVLSKTRKLTEVFVMVLPASQTITADELRTRVLKKSGAKSIKSWDYNQVPVAAYMTDSPLAELRAKSATPAYLGPELQRNLEAYFVKDDIWASVLLVSDSLGAEEEKVFYSLVDSLNFVNVSNPSSSFDYYDVGRSFIAVKNYARAADAFGVALRLERRKQDLDPRHWRDLIMKAAEAYQAMMNSSAAAEALQYGVSKDPANTTLLMLLARTYATQRQIDKTLATLAKCFSYMKQEKILFEKQTGGTMSFPDLGDDPAFKELMRHKSFRDAVKALKK